MNHLNGRISCIKDSIFRCWDLRASLTTPSQTYTGYEETNNAFTSFDISCDDKVVCAGTEAKGDDTHIIFWDRRKHSALGVYSESHQDDITQVNFINLLIFLVNL